MSKIGISIKIDVKKLDKARFFAAQSGAVYVDLTMFLDAENEGQFGDHGFITQSTTKEERDQDLQMPILGNGKIFYGLDNLKGGVQQSKSGAQQSNPNPNPYPRNKPQNTSGYNQQQPNPRSAPAEPDFQFDDDVPF
jgi:hypothetical protein